MSFKIMWRLAKEDTQHCPLICTHTCICYTLIPLGTHTDIHTHAQIHTHRYTQAHTHTHVYIYDKREGILKKNLGLFLLCM